MIFSSTLYGFISGLGGIFWEFAGFKISEASIPLLPSCNGSVDDHEFELLLKLKGLRFETSTETSKTSSSVCPDPVSFCSSSFFLVQFGPVGSSLSWAHVVVSITSADVLGGGLSGNSGGPVPLCDPAAPTKQATGRLSTIILTWAQLGEA